MKQAKSTLKYVHHLKPIFMVRTDDSQLDKYHEYCAKYNTPITLYDGSNIYGAAQTYDMIIDEAVKDGIEHLLILDDDLTFAMVNPIIGNLPMFMLCDADQTATLFEHITSLTCAQMPLMSFTPIMKRSQPSIIGFCQPMMMAYSFYIPHFAAHPEHRFWMGKVIEARCDLNLTLRMLTVGFLTGYMATCFIPDNVNNPGGCSTYRFLEVEKASVEYLKKEFPQYVRTHLKQGWMGDNSIQREAPVISWKKAFNAAAFQKMFNVHPTDWARRHVQMYEIVYTNFVKELRK